MKSRGAAVAIALVLALTATVAMSLYIKGVKKQSGTTGSTVQVIVAKQDIAAGTRLDPLLQEGGFTIKSVPRDLMVKNAVTDLGQLRHQVTSAPVFEGEQLTTDRLGETSLGGGELGIRSGFEALSVELSTERTVAGSIHQGEHVTIYATFEDVSVLSPKAVRDFLAGKAQPSNESQDLGDFTVVLVPDARVLKIDSPETVATSDKVHVTLELSPSDGQRLVMAQEQGKVWLALLPPGQAGEAGPPIDITQGLDLKRVLL